MNNIDNFLNGDILFTIFQNLPGKDLARMCRVNKFWNKVASKDQLWNALDLKKEFNVIIFDKNFWQNNILCNFELNDCPDITNRTYIAVITRMSAKYKIEKVRENYPAFTLLTVPQNMSYSVLKKNLPMETMVRDTHLDLTKLSDVPVPQTYVVAIANGLIENSRNKTKAEHLSLLDNQDAIPNKLEVVLNLLLHNLEYRTTIYEDRVYGEKTRCSEEISGYQLMCGSGMDSGIVLMPMPLEDKQINCGISPRYKF